MLSAVCIVAFTACTDNRAGELYETAQFEELQQNAEHATQLYEEIVNKYPESEFAVKAKDRLAELKD